jgi:hypothetical protein
MSDERDQLFHFLRNKVDLVRRTKVSHICEAADDPGVDQSSAKLLYSLYQ